VIVYVVTSGEYSDYRINAVFDNKEQAELYCATHEDEMPEIEEYDTDYFRLDSAKPVFKKWTGHIETNGKSTFARVFSSCFTLKKKNSFSEYDSWPYNGEIITAIVTLDKNSTEEQAEKAMVDRYMQWEYEREG